jgi:hypothetical protein
MPPGICGTCSRIWLASQATTSATRAAAGLIRHAISAIASDTALWTDDGWLAESTPVECGRPQETDTRRSAGWVSRLRLVCQPLTLVLGLLLHLGCTLLGWVGG